MAVYRASTWMLPWSHCRKSGGKLHSILLHPTLALWQWHKYFVPFPAKLCCNITLWLHQKRENQGKEGGPGHREQTAQITIVFMPIKCYKQWKSLFCLHFCTGTTEKRERSRGLGAVVAVSTEGTGVFECSPFLPCCCHHHSRGTFWHFCVVGNHTETADSFKKINSFRLPKVVFFLKKRKDVPCNPLKKLKKWRCDDTLLLIFLHWSKDEPWLG